MPRTATVTLPYMTAFMRANSAPICSVSAPGRVTTSTPAKPTTSVIEAGRVATLLQPHDRDERGEERRGKADGDRARKRHEPERDDSEGLRRRLRQAARDMSEGPPGREDGAGPASAGRKRRRSRARSATVRPSPRRSGTCATSSFMMALEAANISVAPVMQAIPSGTLSLAPSGTAARGAVRSGHRRRRSRDWPATGAPTGR